ncbi:hypothetical protein [Komagataeibacter medellinensis]|uniref:hypothetical protein n=1 Tax=Komagataeibacter medellinensis TaxID=1177712 RepID=UPI000399A0ED|nr:hypothetical protein [Komagataeibacter medellinensis]
MDISCGHVPQPKGGIRATDGVVGQMLRDPTCRSFDVWHAPASVQTVRANT